MFVPLAALAAAAWVVLLLTAPVLPGWAGATLYGIGSLICHQLPERSFHLTGFQFPVCARCFGIYVGIAGGGLAVWPRGERVSRLSSQSARRVAAAAALPTLATVALEFAGLWFPSNATRAVAGLPVGVIAGFVVVNALAAGSPPRTPPPHLAGPGPAPFDTRSGRSEQSRGAR